MWQPKKSTILSVLVSIQAMILGAPVPYINEPGYHTLGASTEASRYTMNVQCMTVWFAMISWLSNDKTKEGIWQTIDETFWKFNSTVILDRVRDWARDNNALLKYQCRGHYCSLPAQAYGRNLVKILE